MNINDFLSEYPIKNEGAKFDKKELEILKNSMPDSAIAFLEKYGRCTFGNGILSSIYPSDIKTDQIFRDWGFKKLDYKVFLKNCFGVLIFTDEEDYYYLDPLRGKYQNIGNDIEVILNIFFLGGAYYDKIFHYSDFINKKEELPAIGLDEIYMLVPTLALGGSFETSKFEPGKLVEHLAFLAQINDNKAEEV